MSPTDRATNIIYTATKLFHQAGDNACHKLIKEVISPLPNIIPLEASLEADRAIITQISISIETRRVRELLGQVTDSTLVLTGHTLRHITPQVLLEAVGNITMAILIVIINNSR
ncbi:hypothetical protein B0T25DRAFT_466968 [Lasiosphaeria hispida]|uniref:Uncharacterized protein n=1 Tax=Lasiosphaeria hispida TaxID=260671 RepID=A0AAJ0H5A0_9PEZI|nr:hypothetical protein B0T25DRAFT_466968 [Lasiosphaeria hispida]